MAYNTMKFLDYNGAQQLANGLLKKMKAMIEFNESKETHCPNCGALITQEVCPYCGTNFTKFIFTKEKI